MFYMIKEILVFVVVLEALGDFIGFAFALGLKLWVEVECKKYYKTDDKHLDDSWAEGEVLLKSGFPFQLIQLFLLLFKVTYHPMLIITSLLFSLCLLRINPVIYTTILLNHPDTVFIR